MRRTSRIVSLLIGIAALAQVSWADGIRATVNRAEATIEDQILLTLTVEGSRSARPTLPDLSDFEVYPRGQSTQMSFVNGQVTSSVSYNYVLVPSRTGAITIGAATVELDGEIYSSEPIGVRIVEASEQPQATRDLFLSTKVSTTRPFVGQEVLYIWRFYRRVRIGDARLEPQDFRGSLVEDLGDVREYQATVNGVEYLVSEIRKSLFAQEAGELVIPASRLTLEVVVRRGRGSSAFDDFFGGQRTETKVLRGREIVLEVEPLPDPPAGYSGLVGSFDIDAQISKAVLQAGESTTLKLTVSGSGNVQMISQPALPEMPSFKMYDDRPTGTLERSGARLTGSRTFSKALVPMEPGERVIPPVPLIFFDPESGEFRQKSTATIALQVLPADGKEDLNLTESLAPTTGKVAVRILADDLLPIHKGLDAVGPVWIHGSGRWLLWAALLVPPLLFAGTFVTQRRRHRFARDVDLRRRHRALGRLRRGLKELARSADEEGIGSQMASRCLRQYIGDKLGVEGVALTPGEVDQQLRERGVDESLVGRTHELLARLEASQYGGASVDQATAVSEVDSLVRSLEGQIR